MKWNQANIQPSNIDSHGTKKLKQKSIVLVVATMVGLAILAGFFLKMHKNPNKPVTAACSVTSDNGVLHAAAGSLDARKSQQLAPIASKIQTLRNYDKDPNCLNVIVTYNINISDYTNAKLNLDKLEAVYEPHKGFSKVLGPDAKNIENLRANVDFLKKQEDNWKKNARYGPRQP